MPLMTPQELERMGAHIVVRTARGNEVIQTDPRQMPRRLRVLLLAIDGTNPVQLYTQTLKGFGDVSALLIELINLGMVALLPSAQAKQHAALARTSSFSALDHLLDESGFRNSAADVLFGTTTEGSFDEMVRVARIDHPDYKPPPTPAPAPVAPPVKKAQIESLFNLLDATRNERKHLKERINKLQHVKQAALLLHQKNRRLQNWVTGLSGVCTILAVALILTLMRR